jgi:Fe-S cluster assembly protein SufD
VQAVWLILTSSVSRRLKMKNGRYTNVEPIAVQSFARANGEVKLVSASEIVARSMVDSAAPRLVFVNGVYSEDLSNSAMLEYGMVVKSLRDFIASDDATAAARLGHYASGRRQPFVALNTAFLEDGAVVSIAAGCHVVQPIYLVFVSTARNQPVVSHPRTLILLGAGSEAKIVESYLGLDGGYFCNAVTELVGGTDSVIEHYRLQQEAIRVSTLALWQRISSAAAT